MFSPFTSARRKHSMMVLQALVWLILVSISESFSSVERRLAAGSTPPIQLFSSSDPEIDRRVASADSVEEASRVLSEWDRIFNQDNLGGQSEQGIPENVTSLRNALEPSIRFLSGIAAEHKERDPTQGRCILGICAPSAQEGIATLKAWVTALGLPRGLLHGMDKDGVPIDLSGAVYIKYNSGGVYTFSDIRKSGMGFDALWKPGDALLEPYDGTYRGVYFQVDLEDKEFRQYLVPLDIF